ncbi:MAG: DNA polymerase III subunit delta, partial [Parasporobacterium sp.]|nr:DNA polymerase III subunit delta [Parasporobacterium sp.]
MSNQEKLLGNQNNLKHLTEAACRGKLSHAYIIAGADGSGKKTFADLIARTLLCNENTDFSRSEPCGHCSACTKTSSGNHPDLIWVTHEKPRLISVGEVREQIVGPMKIIPYYGPKKIFIVPDAHLMNENAQNALLKTIEEPPEYGLIFLLVNNADYLLDTIRSRCLRLDMELLGTETVLSELVKRGCERNIALKAA